MTIAHEQPALIAQWREIVEDAVAHASAGDRTSLDMVVRLLAEQDDARHRLRAMGYGCIGRPWAGIVDDIEDRQC
jgi:hypothetical protein